MAPCGLVAAAWGEKRLDVFARMGANNVPRICRVAISEQGFRIVGADNAPAKVGIFMDPQCPSCGQFDAMLGGDIAHQIQEGQLRFTYRALTVEDEIRHHDYSNRAAQAMLLAAGRNSGTS